MNLVLIILIVVVCILVGVIIFNLGELSGMKKTYKLFNKNIEEWINKAYHKEEKQ